MTVVKFMIALFFSVFTASLRHGIRAQTTLGFSSEDDTCSHLEEGCEFEAVENMRLRIALESKQKMIEAQENELRLLRVRKLQSVTATYLRNIDNTYSVRTGMIPVEDKIYVLYYSRPYRIDVFENGNDFHFVKKIPLNIEWPYNIVYSHNSKSIYITDRSCCIWQMTTTGEHRLTKWLSNLTWPFFLTLCNEGNLLLLRGDQSPSHLEFRTLNATLIRRLQLPQDIKIPNQVVQASTGNFIILHTLNNKVTGPWVISQLTSDGLFVHQFIPRNQSVIYVGPHYYLSLDSENNLLFVGDSTNNRVLVLDSSALTWSHDLMIDGRREIDYPLRMFFDAYKKRLFVLEHHRNATVYQINYNLC